MPIPVLINRAGGTAAARGGALRDEIESAFADAGLAIDLHLLDGRALHDAVTAQIGAPVVVVGGGDGTLGCAAECLAGTDTALGILALGTRNHLARELGLPLDLPGAARVIADRPLRHIDLARVNGHAFVNNASIGLYPSLVRYRDAERDRHLVPKWLAAVPACYAALKRLRHHRLYLSASGTEQAVVTPMLFVGNNRYELVRGRIGERRALDDGVLSIFAVASHRRLALIGFALRTFAGRADPKRDFAAIGDAAALTVTGASRDIDVALDGEVMRLKVPLHFTIEPRSLRVVAPLSQPTA